MAATIFFIVASVLFAGCLAAAPPCTGAKATACPNELGDVPCNATFGETTAANQSANCASVDYAAMASKCRKQCWTCCQDAAYNCEDGKVWNCTELAASGMCKSTVPEEKNIAANECPASCGLCASGTCADTSSNCQALTDSGRECKNVDYYATFQSICKRTCGFCDASSAVGTTASPGVGGSCVDVATNCAANVALCSNAAYKTLMSQKCAKTCNMCGSTNTGSGTGTGTCVDANTNCATWITNGFCQSAYYTSAQKSQYCRRSCNLC